jgi:predicted TPR repeat methyltransferase
MAPHPTPEPAIAPQAAAMPESLRDAVALAITLLRANRAEDAETLLAQMRERFPNEGDVLNLSGIAARLLGHGEAAVRLTAAAVATDPESGLFHANHGAALAMAGHKEEAVEAFEAAVRLRPDDANARRNLGILLAELGRGKASIPQLRRATELAPDDPETQVALARLLHEAGDQQGAGEAAAHALRLLPPEQLADEARFIAQIVAGQTPSQAPTAYLRHLFDSYADSFDNHLVEKLGYRTPELLGALLGRAMPARGNLRVLDLGCGTGLSGAVLKPFAAELVGVDLSPAMLVRAGARGVYDALHEAELMAWLSRQHAASCDLAAAADVLIYLGDLAPVFDQVRRVLAPGGHFLLSLEDRLDDGAGEFGVAAGLRYQHHPDQVVALAARHGFTLAAREAATLRLERGYPVAGTLLLLQRTE